SPISIWRAIRFSRSSIRRSLSSSSRLSSLLIGFPPTELFLRLPRFYGFFPRAIAAKNCPFYAQQRTGPIEALFPRRPEPESLDTVISRFAHLIPPIREKSSSSDFLGKKRIPPSEEGGPGGFTPPAFPLDEPFQHSARTVQGNRSCSRRKGESSNTADIFLPVPPSPGPPALLR